MFITVGAEAGRFARLRVDAAHGRPRVLRLRIEYVDGTHRVANLDTTLHLPRRPSAYVDLRGAREIAQVIVMTDRSSKGSYTVHAEREAAVDDDGVATR